MRIRRKDFSYFHRLENAVESLATSPKSARTRVELAFSSFLVPIIPTVPSDSVDRKLCEAFALATQYPAIIKGEGTLHATMRKVRFSTLQKIMVLIFDACRELRLDFQE